eukprot:19574-Eustigmatos_ZCMA.PRE.1
MIRLCSRARPRHDMVNVRPWLNLQATQRRKHTKEGRTVEMCNTVVTSNMSCRLVGWYYNIGTCCHRDP